MAYSYVHGEMPLRFLQMGFLSWERPTALKILQGESLRGVLGPRYLPLAFTSIPAYSVRPALLDVLIAEPLQLLDEKEVGQLLQELIPLSLELFPRSI